MKRHHAIATIRDVVEVVAILAAGIWAFYVFAYENRIKPSLAEPDVDVSASLQRLSEHNGLIGVGVRTAFRNVGTVKAHFLGIAVNVYGERVIASQTPQTTYRNGKLTYEFSGFYRTGAPVPVYSYAYVTQLGDPSTSVDSEIDPGTSIENYRTFYVPAGKFDLLTVGIDAPYTKYDAVIPTQLVVDSDGSTELKPQFSSRMNQFNIRPVTSLDLR